MSSGTDSVSSSGHVFVPRLSLAGMDIGGMPYSRSRKLSRNMSTVSMSGIGPLGSPTSPTDQTTVQSRKTSRVGAPQLQRRTSQMQAALGKGGIMENGVTTTSTSDSTRSTLPAITETRRMNLSDVIIWKRVTKALKQRVADKKSEKRTFCWLDRTPSSRSGTRDVPEILMEPSYRMDPGPKLPETKCQRLVTEYLTAKLTDMKYEPESCGEMSKLISEEIRLKIKTEQLLPPRYKCVVYVVLGEKKDQAITVTSQSAWDQRTDNYVSSSFQNGSIFCVVTVFAVYME